MIPRLHMLVVGLTGGIGAGKTAVAHALAAHGAVVSDSDRTARELLTHPAVREKLVQWWGQGILNEAGQVDRSKVAQLVFTEPTQRGKLEKLIHPMIHEQRRHEMQHARAKHTRLFVIDAPLLIEAGLDRECDQIVFVDAPRDQRLARVLAKRGWDEAELTRREAAQLPLEEKKRRAGHVIVNDGNANHLMQQVLALIEKLRLIALGQDPANHRA